MSLCKNCGEEKDSRIRVKGLEFCCSKCFMEYVSKNESIVEESKEMTVDDYVKSIDRKVNNVQVKDTAIECKVIIENLYSKE